MEDNSGILSRLRYLMDTLKLNQTEFSKRLEIDPSNLSKYMNERLPVSESLLNRIAVNMGVSKEWLATGRDLPFAKRSTLPTEVTFENLPLKDRGTPVFDLDATAGPLPRTTDYLADQIIGYVNLPSMIGKEDRIVRVSGDSMEPVICDGDYIAVREISNYQQIFWGQIYLIILEDYRLVKYVRKHSNPEMLILRSANNQYDDMEIYRSDLQQMMFVQSILHIQSRM